MPICMGTTLFWRRSKIYTLPNFHAANNPIYTPSMADAKRNASNHHHRHPRPRKRPSLTHFLCLPLVNPTSILQWESSITKFKAAYPPVPVTDLPQGGGSAHDHLSRAVLPEGAIRPLGTLHLTLGVMNLPTKERLDEALAFFHSLDLAGLMSEAGRVAAESREKRNRHRPSPALAAGETEPSSLTYSPEELGHPDPFVISLESLHALPRAKAATVLHASPVDPTGRLYPFCSMLRDKFIEAGFIETESKPQQPNNENHLQNDQNNQIQSGNDQHQPDPGSSQDGAPSGDEKNSSRNPYVATLTRKPKIRPLLLHATVVNTIYVHGRQKPHMKCRKPIKRIEIDARDILARYRDYYVDESRTTEKCPPAQFAAVESPASDASSVNSSTESNNVGDGCRSPAALSPPRYPFIWAKDVLLDSLCICEMGAKKPPVDDAEESLSMNERLGEVYTAVAQRSLHFLSRSSTPRQSVDGGVRLE